MSQISKNIGPGFLLAGAAIGVSHLVQSTRAGAEYGWILIFALIVACVSKYPFLMMGPRYTAATGQNLIKGYKKLGKLQYYTFIFISLASMFIVLAAVTLVTGGLAAYFFPSGFAVTTWCFIILSLCFCILFFGKYNTLDKSMKVIISLLTTLTFLAVIVAAFYVDGQVKEFEIPSLASASSIVFIVAFMGWMPIPIDASIWHSIWTQEKSAFTQKKTTAQDAFLDFNVGYTAASLIAVLFFMLGVLVMFGSGLVFSDSSIVFSGQLIDLYAKTLGLWTKPFIGFAAFITMFSTTLSVADAYPRVISEIFDLEKDLKRTTKTRIYFISIFLICVIALIIIQFGSHQFKYLVDFAAGVSFLAAPFLAWFNYQVFQQEEIPDEFKLNRSTKIFSLSCLIGLIGFNIIYIWSIIYI